MRVGSDGYARIVIMSEDSDMRNDHTVSFRL